MKLPWRDGGGALPDTGRELFFDLVMLVSLSLLFVFTGLDAQVEYAVTQPNQYFSLSSVEESDSINKVILDQSEFDGLSFTSQNRIGMDAVGSELGFCGGIRDDGEVYDLRVAEGFDEVTFNSVQFSCVEPYNFIGHTQPGSDELSQEDKSFDGEIRPDVTCIVSSELTVSPLSQRVGGIDCWFVTDAGGFDQIPVFLG